MEICLQIQLITCWRANSLVLTTQLLELYNEKQVEEGHELTTGHSHWVSDNPKQLILAWVGSDGQSSQPAHQVCLAPAGPLSSPGKAS